MKEKKEILISLKQDIKNDWDQILDDYDYCVNFIAVKYPILVSEINEIAELEREDENSLREKISNIINKYPDIEDISMNFNYGLFQEIAERHDISSWFVKETFRDISVEKGQGVGLLFDKNNYVNEVIMPGVQMLLEEEERHLTYICEKDVHFRYQVQKEFSVMLPGFKSKEKRDFERTVLKIWQIRMRACVMFAAIVINRLAIAHNDGKIAKEEYRWKNNNVPLWRLKKDELFSCKLELEYAPTRMNLKELLFFITRSINEMTKETREFKDLVCLGVDIQEKNFVDQLKKIAPDDFAFPIPPLKIEEVHEIFIEEKVRLLREKKICMN